MNIIQVIGIIFITSATCFLGFQLWYYAENYDYILKYNKTYSNLEYAHGANINYEDKSVPDPNDNVFDVNKKWRCAEENNKFYAVSEYGFLSTESTSIKLIYSYYKDCIINLFDTQIKIVYNPCEVAGSSDCLFLQRLMASTS